MRDGLPSHCVLLVSCVLSCGSAPVRIKACGGLGPYTWSKTGNCSLSSTTGIAITVSTTAIGGANPSPNKIVFIKQVVNAYFVEETNACGAGNNTYHLGMSSSQKSYDCDQIQIFGGTPSSCGHTDTLCLRTTGCGAGTACGGFGTLDSSCCGTTPPTAFIDVTVDVTGANCNGATFTHTYDVPFPSGTLFSPVLIGESDFIDLRNTADIAAGCGCSQGSTTVTVTDAAGVQSTVILAV